MELQTIWVVEDGIKSSAYRVADIKIIELEFPILQKIPNELRHDKEERWRQHHKEIAASQRAFVLNHVLKAFIDSYHECMYIDKALEYLLGVNLRAFTDAKMSFSPGIHTNFITALNENCIEVTFDFISGTLKHRIHACNLSPSEYARLR